MEIKKKQKYNLEKKRGLFLNLGLVAAGALTLAAFTYSVPLQEKDLKNEIEKKAFKEVFEVVPKILVQKNTEEQQPRALPIFNPENIKEIDKVEPEPLVDPLPDLKFPKPDFKIGKLGTGTKDPGGDDTTIFDTAELEKDPQFPGGDNEMARFIQKNYKVSNFMDVTDQGTVYVRMVVTKDGDITDIEIARGVSLYVDKEALRVVKIMPKWIPGKYRGRNVNVRMVIPIRIVFG